LIGRDADLFRGMLGSPERALLLELPTERLQAPVDSDALQGAILNLLGEHYGERSAVESAVDEYVALLDTIRARSMDACLSIKPTQCGMLVGQDFYWATVKKILERVDSAGGFLWMDMEDSRWTDRTLDVYRRALALYRHVGVAVQCNLRRTERDVESLLDIGGIVRLCKGAYHEVPPVGTADRRETDATYHRILDLLFDRADRFAVASHDAAMIDHALERNRSRPRRFEFQMLLGVRDPLKDELAGKGHRVLEYIPYGPNWLPYFTRRLRERPRNILTMVRSFVGG
jgi:proline dehydrogenase